jgi:hypothetical protein
MHRARAEPAAAPAIDALLACKSAVDDRPCRHNPGRIVF